MSKNTSQTLARLDRALTREQLRRSEALLRAIAESSPLAILVIDEPAEQVLYFNRLFLEVLGIEHLEERLLTYDVGVRELVSHCPEALTVERPTPQPSPSEAEEGKERKPASAPPSARSVEKTTDEVILPDGRALRRFTTAVRDRGGRDVGLLIALEDITAERRAREVERRRTVRMLAFQAALLHLAEHKEADLEAELRVITEVDALTIGAKRVGYWKLSPERTAGQCSVCFDVGASRHETLDERWTCDARHLELLVGGKPIVVDDVSSDERVAALRPQLKEAGIGALLDMPVRCEGRVVGFLRHERREATGWSLEEQEFAASVGEMTSVALEASARRAAELALKKLQEHLVLTDRMASVGTLAAGVAHEINNPLAFVIANLSYIHETFAAARAAMKAANVDVGELDMALAEALEGADRVKRIVQSLRSFSKADGGDRRAVDVRRILELSIRMTSNQAAHRAELKTDFQEVPLVVASEAELGQVFLNILLNGIHSIQERLAKTTRAEAGLISIRSFTGDAGEAVVEIRDNGVGMTAAQQKRAFDPFYTTKPVGTGTGLGLFVSRNILLNVGGELTIESAEGHGCLVRISIPPQVAAGNGGPVAAGGDLASPGSFRAGQRRGRILVIDDEPTIGAVIERMLRSEHDVFAASDAREALARLVGGEGFDVILCDLLMPGLTGMELHEQLATEKPDIAKRMIFFSGGAFTARAEAFLRTEKHRCIEKPFDARELRARVRSML